MGGVFIYGRVFFLHMFFGKDGYSFTEDRNSQIILNFLPGRQCSPMGGCFSFLKQGVTSVIAVLHSCSPGEMKGSSEVFGLMIGPVITLKSKIILIYHLKGSLIKMHRYFKKEADILPTKGQGGQGSSGLFRRRQRKK